jgi:pimeloyl-ACP methyl ester carboxylesterase
MRMWPLLAALACGGTSSDKNDTSATTALGPSPACDGLDPGLCALPWPSSFYQPSAATESGVMNTFPAESMPVNRDSVPVKPDALNELDGFSTLTPLLVDFGDVSLDGVIGHQDLEAYLAADAKTVILNAETGERIPHFAELDRTAEPGQQLFILRPVVAMDHGTRHIVGIRGLQKASGGAVTPSPGFTALRDGSATDDPGIEARRDRFDTEVFPALETTGFARGELQLAWDFTTISRDHSFRRLLHMRDDARAQWGASGPAYVIDSVEDHDCSAEDESIGRTIEGTLTVPLYTDIDSAGAVLTRDADGMPTQNGTGTSRFLVRVPCSVTENPEEGGFLLQYGHGLLGSRYEANSGWLGEFADRHRLILFAQDWKGMSDQDAGFITLMLAFDVSDFNTIPERSMQGLVELVGGLDAARGALASDPSLAFGAPGEEVPVIDPERYGYYGLSQGAILGGAYLSLSPDPIRGVLGVGGMPYSILLSRSANFSPFFLVFQEKFTDGRDIALILGMWQTLWDPGESSGYAHTLTRDPLPGSPAKDVLMQVAIGDAQVTSLGAHIAARMWDAPTVAPQTRPVWGVEESEPGFSGSALVEWLYVDGPTEPVENTPPDAEFDPHECTRREPEAQQQAVDFLFDGVVTQPSDGPCTGTVVGTCQ